MKKFLVLFLILGMFTVFIPNAKAYSVGDLYAQIKTLQNQVSTLSSQLSGLALRSAAPTAGSTMERAAAPTINITPLTTKVVLPVTLNTATSATSSIVVPTTSNIILNKTTTNFNTKEDKIEFSLSGAAKIGDSSLDVENVQIVLVKEGYLLNEINGYFDKKTKEALLNFQKVQGLKQTGEIDPPTKNMLSLSLNLSPYEIYSLKEISSYVDKNKVNIKDLKEGQALYRTTTGGLLIPSPKIVVVDPNVNGDPEVKANPGRSDVSLTRLNYDVVFEGVTMHAYSMNHYGGLFPHWRSRGNIAITEHGGMFPNGYLTL